MEYLKKYKLPIIGGICVLLLIVGFWAWRGKSESTNEVPQVTPTEAVIPTVDSSVVVTFEATGKTGEAKLTVAKAPTGTKKIEYEITYNRVNKEEGGVLPDGFFGPCVNAGDLWVCGPPDEADKTDDTKRTILFATCSSGKCTYHEIVGKPKVTLLFSGDYGEKIYEKEFEF